MRALFLVGMAAAAAMASVPALAATPEVVTIVNTGSTNTVGYNISLRASGQVLYATTGSFGSAPAQAQQGRVAKTLTSRLFTDLSAAMPLAQLPSTLQMKSASFGTSTYITYKGQRTPDLSAPADARGQALKADITAIAAALNLKNGPRRPGPTLTPSLPGH